MEKLYQLAALGMVIERIGSVVVLAVEKHTTKAKDNTYRCYCGKYDRWNTVNYKAYIAAKQKGEWSGARWRKDVAPIVLGKAYGQLTPQAIVAVLSGSNAYTKAFSCLCACGKTVIRAASSVRSLKGHCGCRSVNRNTIHPQLQSCHRNMFQRCYNSKNKSYAYYGGRGINVTAEWHNYFAFEAWAIAAGFAPGLSIDRIDNDLGYAPDNCRWVSMQAQARNRRSNVLVEHVGEVLCRREFALLHQTPRLPYKTIEARLKSGITTDAAISPTSMRFDAFGESKKLTEWCLDSRCVVNYKTLQRRIHRGWPIEQALRKVPRRGARVA